MSYTHVGNDRAIRLLEKFDGIFSRLDDHMHRTDRQKDIETNKVVLAYTALTCNASRCKN